jgi:hypothetical protein
LEKILNKFAQIDLCQKGKEGQKGSKVWMEPVKIALSNKPAIMRTAVQFSDKRLFPPPPL